MSNVLRRVTGTIEMDDGTTSEYLIRSDGGYSQWGATKDRLGASQPVVEALAQALIDEDIAWEDDEVVER